MLGGEEEAPKGIDNKSALHNTRTMRTPPQCWAHAAITQMVQIKLYFTTIVTN